MLRRLRRIAFALALVGLAGAVCALWLLGRVDEEIRAEVERRFRAHYPALSVTIRSARWQEGQGIRLRGVSIVEPTGDFRRAELAYVEELFAITDAKLKDVVLAEIPVEKVVFRGLTIHSTRQADGSWSGWRLWPPPSFSETPPAVQFENAQIEFIDPRQANTAPLVLREVNLDVEPRTESDPATGQPVVTYHVRGSLASDHFRRADIDAAFRESGGQWSSAGTVENLQLSPELWQSLPQDLARMLPAETNLLGRTSFRFQASNQPQADPPLQFAIAGDFSDMRVSDPRLPYSITDFEGTAYLDHRQLKLENAQARCGPASVQLAYQREGWTADARQTLHVRGEDLPLDPKLVAALPDGLALWNMLQPTGTVSVDAALAWDGVRWRPAATVQLLDVSFATTSFRTACTGARENSSCTAMSCR
jgi:hypothetical protein